MSILAVASSAKAQVTPDGTLSTRVTSSDNQNFIIEAGDRTGNHLFHSFSEFSVPTNGSAVFNNAITIESIFGRITDNNISSIDGLIQANGTANVFLLNPNGIVFGENASLNIGGSFMATTAEHILFSDNTVFSAVDGASNPLLTVSAPVGLGLGTNPGPITVAGPGHSLRLNFSDAASTPIRDNRTIGLQVNAGNTLALIGGDIFVEGGNLTANQGRIELGSVAQAGRVSLIPTPDGFTHDYDSLERFGDISFTQESSIDVSGEGSGNLYLQAENLSVLEGSTIISNVLGADDGGEVRVQVSDVVNIQSSNLLDGFSSAFPSSFPSSFFNQGESNSTGQVGKLIFDVGDLRILDGGQLYGTVLGQGNGSTLTIRASDVALTGANPILGPSMLFTNTTSAGNGSRLEIEANTLQIEKGARIESGTSGSGDGGSLFIRANEVTLNGVSSVGRLASGISADTTSEGNAGRLDIQVNTLRVEGGTRISSATFGQGEGGSLSINAEDITISGISPSGRVASAIDVVSLAEGNGGRLEIETNTLLIEGGAQINSGTFGQGDGNALSINATDIAILGSATDPDTFTFRPSQITATTRSAGNGGGLEIEANTLQVEGGAQINSGTSGLGNAGPLSIRANDIALSGEDIALSREDPSLSDFFRAQALSEIRTDTFSAGNGGRLEIEANTLQLEGGARIDSGTSGLGNAGPLFIRADDIKLSGVNSSGEFSTGIFASAAADSGGKAGNIALQVEALQVTEEARISASSLGVGDASDLNITANQILLTDGGALSAEVAASEQGNIFLTTDTFLLMRRGASISTNATGQATGGNITIESPVAIGLEDSDIIANAVEGNGGQINITTQALLGLEFRDSQTSESDITASSDFGQSGTVDINLPETEPTAEIVELPADLADASARIGQSLCAGEGNSFTASGRGGLSSSPYETQTGSVTWEDWYISEQVIGERLAIDKSPVVERPVIESPVIESPVIENERVVEAQGWGTDAGGNVVLTTAPTSVISKDGFVGGVASCQTVREALSTERE